MSWATVSAAIKTELETVSDVGPVYVGDRYLRDDKTVYDYFHDGKASDGRERYRGWRIVRESIAEGPGIVGAMPTLARSAAREQYTLIGLESVSAADDSETDFQHLLDRVLTTFRGEDALGGSHLTEAATVKGVGYADLAGERRCHYAEISLPVIEVYSIPSTASPTHVTSVGTVRDGYEDVAEQIAAYIELGDTESVVHTERPLKYISADVWDAFGIDVGPSDTSQTNRIQTWRIFRDLNAEERGAGNRIEADARWRALWWRTWADSVDSYGDTQVLVDAVRAVFRGVGCLGNASNPTMSLSAPLQIREIGTRWAPTQILCHYVDAELRVSEVVHA